MRNFKRYLAVAFATVLAPVAAFATPSPYEAIETAADWTAVGTVIGGIAAALALVLVIRKGLRLGLSMVK